METETKEIIKEKEYVHGRGCGNYLNDGWYDGCGDGYCRRRGVDNGARALGIVGTVAGGLALLGGAGKGLFRGGYNAPENVNINANMGGMGSYGRQQPTAFEAYAHECDEVLALTNEIWGLKVGTLNQMYEHRDTDINEKFSLYKSQIDADFGLYKSQRDADDAIIAKHNADVFSLYKGQRDGFDVLNKRIYELETKVAVNEAVRPYQDKLIQCEIRDAFKDSINYTDRKTCKAIYGEVVLPNTPVVSGYGSYNPCVCPQAATASK